MSHGPVAPRRARAAAALAAAALAASCMANPGDPPVVADAGGGAPPEPAPAGRDEEVIEIGVGVFGEGFNPHLAATADPVTDLVADMVLPSAFIPDPDDPARLVRNPDLLSSAAVLGPEGTPAPDFDAAAAAPGAKTLRYRIAPGAQWSDGTPISGADFTYLREGMVRTPGVRGGAGYERITSITVAGAGRVVDVAVEGPLPQWRELFRHLLPSHLLRAGGGSFATIMRDGVVASGAAFAVENIDIGRNEVRLVRNDRFWGNRPPLTETVVLRAERGPVPGAEQLRTGRLQAVQVRPEETTALAYSMVPGATLLPTPRARTLTLQANLASPWLSDRDTRRAVLAAVSQRDVAAVATGRRSDLVIPAPPASIAEADRAALPPGPLVIGAMDGEVATAAARVIAAELTAAGVETTVSRAEPDELARTALPHGMVDLVVGWADDADTVLAAADRFGCPARTRIAGRTGDPATGLRGPGRAGAEGEPAPGAEGAAPAGEGDGSPGRAAPDWAPEDPGEPVGRPPARGGNLSGLCDPLVERLLAEHAAEVVVPAELRAAIDAAAVALPIVADGTLTVIGEDVAARGRGAPAGWPAAADIGALLTLPDWRRVPAGRAADPDPGADPGDPDAAPAGQDRRGPDRAEDPGRRETEEQEERG